VFRFADQQMYMFGHNYVSVHAHLVPLSNPFQR
jgi:hypothetical protein